MTLFPVSPTTAPGDRPCQDDAPSTPEEKEAGFPQHLAAAMNGRSDGAAPASVPVQKLDGDRIDQWSSPSPGAVLDLIRATRAYLATPGTLPQNVHPTNELTAPRQRPFRP